MVTVTPQERMPHKRTFLMCPPRHFTVEYVINPWMDPTAPVDGELAQKQWDGLRETLVELGHEVHVLPALPGLPDMVYAANGGFSVDGGHAGCPVSSFALTAPEVPEGLVRRFTGSDRPAVWE